MYLGLVKPEDYNVFVFSRAAILAALLADSFVQHVNAAGARVHVIVVKSLLSECTVLRSSYCGCRLLCRFLQRVTFYPGAQLATSLFNIGCLRNLTGETLVQSRIILLCATHLVGG